MGAVRGTTPDYVLALNGYDLTGKTVFVTIAQGGIKTTLTGDRLTIATDESGSAVAFELTQAETLRFKAGDVEVQLKCINSAGKADGSGIGQLTIDRALLEREIAYADADDTD